MLLDELRSENARLLAANLDCVDHFNQIKEDFDKLTIVVDDYRATLEKLAKLGNGDRYGNSIGNEIAIDALNRHK